jgi:ankyrin repeat protein
VKRRIVVAVILAVLLAGSAYAQANLFGVALNGTLQDVQAAIDQGADVNAYSLGSLTPLIIAAGFNQNPDVIKALLKAGANMETRDKKDEIGGFLSEGTALIWAAYNNPNPDVITTLLEAGADSKARSKDNRTALMWAVWNNPNAAAIILVLLNAGADAKAKDSSGMIALDFALYKAKLQGTDALKQLEEASK